MTSIDVIEFFELANLPELLDLTASTLRSFGYSDVALQWSPAPAPPSIMEANSLIVWDNFEETYGDAGPRLAEDLTAAVSQGLQTMRAETLQRQQWLVRKSGPFLLIGDAPEPFALSDYEHDLARKHAEQAWLETAICPVSRERDQVLLLTARTHHRGEPKTYRNVEKTLLAFWYAYRCLYITSVTDDGPAQNQSDAAPLSGREIECLQWLAAGKTLSESATILGISERTLRFHVNNARERLGVATTTQAIVAATLKHGFHTSDARKSVYKISRQR
ncbi:MAG: helix-turn-helix transcriptional regulator [Pseudomonadota bacterium]